MGRRGPAKTPTTLRLLNGETRKDRINLKEPLPRDVPPDCPSWFDAETVLVWNRVTQELEAMGLAKSADQDALAVYCQAVVLYAKACKLVNGSGLLIKGREGNPVKNPAMAMVRDYGDQIRVMGREFGLTPSARTGLEIEQEGDIPGARSAERLLS
jgi:P27 family predicted phage terminase small subunit